jgi:molecular chaperone GrpE
MDVLAKEALLIRLQSYLNELDTIAENATCDEIDRFSIVAELAAIKNEVKLESRQIKTALDLFKETFEVLRQAYTQLEISSNKQREQEIKLRQESERSLLMDLLELRDRLQAGHEHLSNYSPNWLARWNNSSKYVAGIAEGQTMLLRRLDEILARRSIQPLQVTGKKFDPVTMHAIQAVSDSNIEDGIVVSEIRTGFLYHNQLLRPAEVTVNKIASA